MRFFYVLTALCVGSFALLSLTPETAEACDHRFYGGPVYYQPAPVVYYSWPPYYAPPVYYQPRAYYAPPTYYQPPSGRASSPARPTTTINIGASDDYFDPGKVNVQPGTTVRWVNKGRHKHTVTSNDRLFDSGDLAPGATYSVTFTRPGTYVYYCRHHTKEKMQGTIVVGGASSGSSGY
jgi:plastocyanin